MAGLGDIADELESVARHLRAAGETGLVRELTAAMRRAVSPVRDEIRAGLDPHLPRRYAEELDADVRLGINVRTTGSDPGVEPGWFTGPCEAAGPRVRRELERALDDTAGKAAGRGV